MLEHLVSKGAPTERTVAHLMKQVLAGLDYMHSHTVFHLDVRVSSVELTHRLSAWAYTACKGHTYVHACTHMCLFQGCPFSQ